MRIVLELIINPSAIILYLESIIWFLKDLLYILVERWIWCVLFGQYDAYYVLAIHLYQFNV